MTSRDDVRARLHELAARLAADEQRAIQAILDGDFGPPMSTDDVRRRLRELARRASE